MKSLFFLLCFWGCFSHALASDSVANWQHYRSSHDLLNVDEKLIEQNLRTKVASEVFDSFLRSGKYDYQTTVQLTQEEKQILETTIKAFFFTQSLERLRALSLKSSALAKLMNQIPQDSIPVFAVFSLHDSQTFLGTKAAGVHRGNQSMYFSLSQIPHQYWFLIFLHELVHHCDSLLMESELKFSEIYKQVEVPSDQLTNVSQLGRELYHLLFDLITAGLNRGLWAEYRAWAVTFIIHKQLRARDVNLFELNPLLKKVENDLEWKEKLYQDLKNRTGETARVGLFRIKIVRKMEDHVIAQSGQPGLGPFDDFDLNQSTRR